MLNILSLFVGYLLSIFLIRPLTSYLIFLTIKHDLHPHVFSKILFHMFYNMLI
jgi:hypothetical protein